MLKRTTSGQLKYVNSKKSKTAERSPFFEVTIGFYVKNCPYDDLDRFGGHRRLHIRYIYSSRLRATFPLDGADDLSVHVDTCTSGCFCCRHGPPLVAILAWLIVPTPMAIETTKYDTRSFSSWLHTPPLTSWSCRLLQAAERACECGILTKPFKSLLVGRSNQSEDSRASLWSSRTTRHGHFLAARRRWLHGSCRSRCANAVSKSLCPCL